MVSTGKMLAFINALGGGAAAPSEVVILPETVFEIASQGQPAYIREPLSATPTNGATAKVSYNGTEYMCQIARAEEDGTAAFVIGNFDAMGMPVPGSNPTVPIVAVLYEAEENGAYGMIVSLEDVSTVTLSIVQVGAESEEATGALVVTADVGGSSTEGYVLNSISATFAELHAAIYAGRDVMCITSLVDPIMDGRMLTGAILRPAIVRDDMIVLSIKNTVLGAKEYLIALSSDGTNTVMYA